MLICTATINNNLAGDLWSDNGIMVIITDWAKFNLPTDTRYGRSIQEQVVIITKVTKIKRKYTSKTQKN